MKFLILDVYPSNDHRLVKDTAGGYGTGNDFGNSFFSKLINKFVSKMIAMPPMYAIYVYSIIKSKGHEVSYSRNINDNTKIQEADYIVMPTSIIAHETEIKILHLLSKKNKKIFLIGIFSNVMNKEYHINNSFIVRGEPENFFLNLNYSKKEVDLYFAEGSNQRNSSNGMVSNIDELPFPDWKDYVKQYPLKNNFIGFNSKICIPLLASRGCPYSCFNYCTYPLQQGRKVRQRSVENVVKEIKHWIENLKTNKFVFRDPVFSINRKYTVSLCKEIIRENLKIEFLIETHLKNLDDELIRLLKQAGLKLVYIGIESSDANILKDIKRFTVNNDQQYQIINKLKKNGIYVKSMFMFANPEDSVETIKKTIQYSKFLPNQLVQYSVFTPYPGTPVYNEFKNKITVNKFEKYNQYNLVYNHKSLNNDIIIKLKNLGYRKFYSDIGNLFVVFLSFINFLENKLVRKKNCIITGGTSGLGLALVKKFINNSFFVHIIAKDNKKIQKLVNYFYERDIKSFKFYQADLAEENELNKVILQIKNLDKIDVLINNAGALFLKREVNSKGIEKTFAVNYLSHFYLTISLIDLIKKTKNSRLINISSMVHKFAKLNLNDMNFSKNYNGYVAYFNSKLMNLLFSYKINKIYYNYINCYAIHPGWLNTNFGSNNQSNIRFLLDFVKDKFAKKPSYVADEIYNICTAQEYLNYSGKYFVKNNITKSSDLSYREDLQDELWEKSLKMINTQKNAIK